MSYPYVQSATDLGLRKGPILGFVVHMAEGGGTVAFLAKPNPNGVSVHYVLERSGRIVQMLRESHMHSSIRTTDIRRTDDPDGFYGRTAAVGVLGKWADTAQTLGPNHATIAVEVEGFAKDGPNDDQARALSRLAADIRSRNGELGNLGHRDFADYKACPGKRIDWTSLGGHGPIASEEDMPTFEWDGAKAQLGNLTVNGPGHSYLRLKDGKLYPAPPPFPKRAMGPVIVEKGTILGDTLDRRTAWLIPSEAAVLLAADTTFVPDTLDTKHKVEVSVDGVVQSTLEV